MHCRSLVAVIVVDVVGGTFFVDFESDLDASINEASHIIHISLRQTSSRQSRSA